MKENDDSDDNNFNLIKDNDDPMKGMISTKKEKMDDIDDNNNQEEITNENNNNLITNTDEGKINQKNESNKEKNSNNEKNDEEESSDDNIINTEIKKERITLDELIKTNISFPEEANQGKTGLVNIGNTCFMNSGLQCLSNCYELTKYFLLKYYKRDININNKLGSGGLIAKIYHALLKELWLGTEDYIKPIYFKALFAKFVAKFSGYAQQDSNEFLIYLLDKLHEDLNSISQKPYIEIGEKQENETDEEAANRWWNKHLLRENSIIVDLFQGQFKNTINCEYCGRISVTFDSYMFLSLPIPSGKYEI